MNASIGELAGQCVRCGLCLPHCPTYRLANQEPESPRGRIAMLAALAADQLNWQPELQKHIDQCLSCGHCTRVCPTSVNYPELLIKGRKLLQQKHAASWKKIIALKIIEQPYLRRLGFFTLNSLQKIYMWSVLTFIARHCAKKWAAILALVPVPITGRAFNNSLSPLISKDQAKILQQKVLLFPGCTGKFFGLATLNAAKRLLLQWGFSVVEPPQAWCCGALSVHAGLRNTTEQRTTKSLSKFCKKENISHCVAVATGCSSFSQQLVDIQQFLIEHWPKNFNIKANCKPLRIAVHSPCTQTNGLKDAHLSYKLLNHIPNVTLIPFGATSCCGASGSYMIEQPKMAEKLAAALLTPELCASCDLIVTSNIGCQLHFQQFLKNKNIALRVYHPIEILL